MRSSVVGELGGIFDDLLDERLAGLVLGMGLAGIENLQAAGLGGDLQQPLGIGEQQVGALVGGGAAGKAQREHLGIEHQAGARGHLGQQRLLGAARARPESPASGRSMALRR